jgi:prophage regulatory protein
MQIEILSPLKAPTPAKAYALEHAARSAVVQPSKADRFLPIGLVEEMTSLAQATIYREIAAGRFPRSIRVAAKRVAWSEAEVLEWMRDRAEGRAA